MNYLVCIKQVPDSTQIKVNAESGTYDLLNASSIISPYDKNALEAAVQLKESLGGSVTALTMGSSAVIKALKECISVGADKAALIEYDLSANLDAYSTAALLSTAIKELGHFDAIFCGKQATDSDDGQVGPQIAEQLGISQVTRATKIEMSDKHAIISRESDEGIQVIDVSLPVLITTCDVINEPRFATIKSKMAANRAKIEIFHVSDLNPEIKQQEKPDVPLQVIKISVPPKRATNRIKEKTGRESALKLIKYMLDEKLV
ncbi:MAG: electron transfer flavoprotein subunit beta [Sporolactobacillus sp.]